MEEEKAKIAWINKIEGELGDKDFKMLDFLCKIFKPEEKFSCEMKSLQPKIYSATLRWSLNNYSDTYPIFKVTKEHEDHQEAEKLCKLELCSKLAHALANGDISIESHPIWEEEELRDIIWGWLVANLFAWLKESKSTIRPRMNHPPGHYVLRTFRNKEVPFESTEHSMRNIFVKDEHIKFSLTNKIFELGIFLTGIPLEILEQFFDTHKKKIHNEKKVPPTRAPEKDNVDQSKSKKMREISERKNLILLGNKTIAADSEILILMNIGKNILTRYKQPLRCESPRAFSKVGIVRKNITYLRPGMRYFFHYMLTNPNITLALITCHEIQNILPLLDLMCDTNDLRKFKQKILIFSRDYYNKDAKKGNNGARMLWKVWRDIKVPKKHRKFNFKNTLLIDSDTNMNYLSKNEGRDYNNITIHIPPYSSEMIRTQQPNSTYLMNRFVEYVDALIRTREGNVNDYLEENPWEGWIDKYLYNSVDKLGNKLLDEQRKEALLDTRIQLQWGEENEGEEEIVYEEKEMFLLNKENEKEESKAGEAVFDMNKFLIHLPEKQQVYLEYSGKGIVREGTNQFTINYQQQIKYVNPIYL